MNKILLVVPFLLMGSAAFAQTISHPQNEFKFGLETSYINYTEDSIDVEEKGYMGGLYGIYNYRPDAGFINVYHLDGHINIGVVDYEGSGTIDNIMDYMVEPRAWLGKEFELNGSTTVTPYAGIGYRLLFDDLSGKTSSTGAQGYLRQSQYLYAPVGFEFNADMADWAIGLNAEYDIFIQGWQTSYLSDIPGFPDITNRQKSGYGYRGQIDITKKGDRFDFTVSPFVRFWHVEQSETETVTGSLFQVTGYEPENESLEVGLKLGIGF